MANLRLVLSETATQDLVGVWEYVAEDSLRSADRLVDRIQKKCVLLSENPQIGRCRKELGSGLRSFPMDRYVVFYRVVDDSVLQVVRVLSGYRDINSLF